MPYSRKPQKGSSFRLPTWRLEWLYSLEGASHRDAPIVYGGSRCNHRLVRQDNDAFDQMIYMDSHLAFWWGVVLQGSQGIILEQAITTGWWFQRFFIFTPTWENDPIWLFFFQMGWFNHQPDKRCSIKVPSQGGWEGVTVLFRSWDMLVPVWRFCRGGSKEV